MKLTRPTPLATLATAASLALLVAACADKPPPPPRHIEKPNRPPELERPKPSEPAPPRPAAEFHSTGMTYEEALDVPEDLNDVKGERELSNEDLSGPMQSGNVLRGCHAKALRVTIKVAVREGRAMGVSVATSPDSAAAAECVDAAVRKLVWPSSKKRNTFTTVF